MNRRHSFLLEATLWSGVWDAKQKEFPSRRSTTLARGQQGKPLEMLYNARATACSSRPRSRDSSISTTTPTAPPEVLEDDPRGGRRAPHCVLSPNERYLFVQNSLLNLEGMSDGSITVIDLKDNKVPGSIDTLKKAGFNPNCILLLPNHFQKGRLCAAAQ